MLDADLLVEKALRKVGMRVDFDGKYRFDTHWFATMKFLACMQLWYYSKEFVLTDSNHLMGAAAVHGLYPAHSLMR